MINNKEEILNLLKESVPHRFMNLDPFRFESFIATLFKNMGYDVIETKKVGDYGADVIIENSTEKIAVQVKRYEENNKVGVQEINQVIGAKNFYNCSKAQVVTTSSFSPQGLRLSETTGVILWDWETLYDCIKKTFLEDKDIYNFFKDETPITNENGISIQGNFAFNIDKVEENVVLADESKSEATLVHIKMRNNTNKKIFVEFDRLPSIIDKLGNQFSASWKFQGCFDGGDIFPKCTVMLAFCWLRKQIPSRKVIKQIIINYVENGQNKSEALINYIHEYLEFNNIIDKGSMIEVIDKLVKKYKQLDTIPPHILIKGTLESRNIFLAERIAAELGFELVKITADAIVSSRDIFVLLHSIDGLQTKDKNVALFIKNIDNLKQKQLWYEILNNFVVNLNLKGQTMEIDGTKGEITSNKLTTERPFTVIATTTLKGDMEESLLDLFSIRFLLNEYSKEDISKVIREMVQKDKIKIDSETVLYIIENSLTIPEVAIDYLLKLKNLMLERNLEYIDKTWAIAELQNRKMSEEAIKRDDYLFKPKF